MTLNAISLLRLAVVAISTLSVIFGGLAVAPAESADLVIRHANVLTVDAKQPRASAFAVSGGKFVAIGSEEAVKDLITVDTKVLDLPGKTIVPGFIDAHIHPSPIYPEESRWANVDCSPKKVH